MGAYVVRRLLLMIPTIVGIMAISFLVVQFAPGGPVERVIAQLQGTDVAATARITGGTGDFSGTGANQDSSKADAINSKYRGAQGLDPDFIRDLEKQFGFDKPPLERFGLMLWNYTRFDFGESYFRDISVLKLIGEKMPVSISLGLWMTLLSYAISIPLGIRKAVKDGSRFDMWTSARDHRRLRHPRLPVRDPADRAVRRRLVLRPVSACEGCGRTSTPRCTGTSGSSIRRRCSTISGTWRCR